MVGCPPPVCCFNDFQCMFIKGSPHSPSVILYCWCVNFWWRFLLVHEFLHFPAFRSTYYMLLIQQCAMENIKTQQNIELGIFVGIVSYHVSNNFTISLNRVHDCPIIFLPFPIIFEWCSLLIQNVSKLWTLFLVGFARGGLHCIPKKARATRFFFSKPTE